MSTSSLHNLAVSITVSDPWEFGTECGTGPFAGIITDVSSDRLIIRLSAPIAYRGKSLRTVLARPRHANDLPATVGSGRLLANLILVPLDLQFAAQIGPETTQKGVAAVGTVERAP